MPAAAIDTERRLWRTKTGKGQSKKPNPSHSDLETT
jgi:hypothetical protein